MKIIHPPIKCQGRKSSLILKIKDLVDTFKFERLVEPFCGSCAVTFNLRPPRALLCDVNTHIIEFYKHLQDGNINAETVAEYLWLEGENLKNKTDYYYLIRDRFNSAKPGIDKSLDFLFLTRSSFNGLMRFNKSGLFNSPFCKITNRFNINMIHKICNEIENTNKLFLMSDIEFKVADFRSTLDETISTDLIYADPPYLGRNITYFEGWNNKDEGDLANILYDRELQFVLSTWLEDPRKENENIAKYWTRSEFQQIIAVDHYYKIGPKISNRFKITEGLIFNRFDEGV